MDAEGGAVISHVLFPGPGCAYGGGVMGGECPARTHWAVVCAEALCQLLGRARGATEVCVYLKNSSHCCSLFSVLLIFILDVPW